MVDVVVTITSIGHSNVILMGAAEVSLVLEFPVVQYTWFCEMPSCVASAVAAVDIEACWFQAFHTVRTTWP